MAQVTSCEYGAQWCLYSVEKAGVRRARCMFCRLSPANDGLSAVNWRPVDKRTHGIHPVLWKEKREAAAQRNREQHQARLAKDRSKKRVGQKAARAEKATVSNMIAATKNSGRLKKDGDHVAAGQITLDTKLQSMRDNPVVLLSELAKVREDAERAGNPIGGLVLRNRHGIGIVVFDEKDFARSILSRLTENGNDKE